MKCDELKAFNSARIYWAVEQVEREAGDIDDIHLDDNLFYLKSEVDKVIAEKDAEIVELKERIEVLNHQVCKMNCAMVKHYNEVCDDLIHHKYKRCMAMAKWCEERCYYLNSQENYHLTDKEYQQVIGDYWDRWHKRWLELAEKFKPNSTLQQKD